MVRLAQHRPELLIPINMRLLMRCSTSRSVREVAGYQPIARCLPWSHLHWPTPLPAAGGAGPGPTL